MDLEARSIRLRGKGKKERMVPIGTVAADAIMEFQRHLPHKANFPKYGKPDHLTFNSGSPLFLNVRGGRLTTRSVERMMKQQTEHRFKKSGHSSYPTPFLCHTPT